MIKSLLKLKVRGYELDSFGHVNNAVYLQYAEEAKWSFFEETGLLENVRKKDLFPVILENNLRYMHELKMHDDIRIETEWRTKGKILHFSHRIYNDRDDVLSCTVKGKVVFADSDRMLYDIPEELLNMENIQN